MSLHRILSLFVVALAALVLGAAVSLVLLTTYLHRSTVELETALQSVRVAEEMQIDLLRYISSDDPEARINTERELRNKLQQAHQFVSAPEEEQYLLEAERSLKLIWPKRRHLQASRYPRLTCNVPSRRCADSST